MAYGTQIAKLVQDAIVNKLAGQGGTVGGTAKDSLNVAVDFKFFVSAGAYNPDTDTIADTYNTVTGVACVESRPSAAEAAGLNNVAKVKKLVVPGLSIPQEPQPDTDKVMYGAVEWNIKKVTGVAGGALWLVFISQT